MRVGGAGVEPAYEFTCLIQLRIRTEKCARTNETKCISELAGDLKNENHVYNI